MEKLADTPQFELQLPVWVIMHPTKKSKGYITMAGQPGQSVMPLFTEEGLAQRYRDGAPQLITFLVGRAGDSAEITKVLNSMEGQGFTEVGGHRFEWEANDIVVMPNFLWRRHGNTGSKDAVLYTVSDASLMRNIGQYRAQGRDRDGSVVQLVS